jgi:hypothetical protein
MILATEPSVNITPDRLLDSPALVLPRKNTPESPREIENGAAIPKSLIDPATLENGEPTEVAVAAL